MYREKTPVSKNQGLMNELAENFLAPKAKKTVFGNFRIIGDALIYVSRDTVETPRYYHKLEQKDLDSLREILQGLTSGDLKLHPDFESKEEEILNRLNSVINKNSVKIDSEKIPYFKYSSTVQDTIALKLKSGLIIGNSSILPNVGKTVAYGNVDLNSKETLIQRILSRKIPMIPFNVFEEANLDMQTLKIVDQSGGETIRVNEEYNVDRWTTKTREVERHFTGATIFECDDKQFLFDVDRRELEHKLFNAFLVELPRKVSSVNEAYRSLKPKIVSEAEANGLEIQRQGEWFFIPSEAPKIPTLTQNQAIMALLVQGRTFASATLKEDTKEDDWNDRQGLKKNLIKQIGYKTLKSMVIEAETILESIPKAGALKVGNNRPNNCETVVTIDGITYVKGKVSHQGREHKDLTLKDWHRAVPNSAVKSFTIVGDVD